MGHLQAATVAVVELAQQTNQCFVVVAAAQEQVEIEQRDYRKSHQQHCFGSEVVALIAELVMLNLAWQRHRWLAAVAVAVALVAQEVTAAGSVKQAC